MIRASLIGSPPRVCLKRTGDISDEAWFEINQLLAPGEAVRHNRPLLVPLPRFLGARRQLVLACRPRKIGLDVDQGLRAFLECMRDEEHIVLEILNNPPTSEPASPQPESQLKRELMWFQRRDFAKLIGLPHAANFSVPGAGKTTVAYAVYENERCRGRVAQLLVIAPLSAFETWETEAVECFMRPVTVTRYNGDYIPPDTEVLLINYQRLQSAINRVADWCVRRPTHVILDEAHRMKRGRPGVWASACLDISLLAARRDVLTGTPAPNRPNDLVALMDFLWPRPGGRRILPIQVMWPDPPDWAIGIIHQRISPLFVRTTKSDLGLPPVQFRVVEVQMGDLQRAIYAALRRQYAGVFDFSRRDAAMFAKMGEVTMHLLQAATNPKLLARGSVRGVSYTYPPTPLGDGTRLASLIEDATYHKHEMPAKWVALAQFVNENRLLGRKTLVWSNFPENLLDLESQFEGLHPALIYGAVPSLCDDVPSGTRTREGELRRFRQDSDCWVLLANPQATAEGVSLHTACHDAVYVDRTFNAGQYLQSLDRIHRLGLGPEDETRITFLISTGTIDETIDRRVVEKAERLSKMLNDPNLVEMALPDEEDYGCALDSEEDLAALFEHLSADPDYAVGRWADEDDFDGTQ